MHWTSNAATVKRSSASSANKQPIRISSRLFIDTMADAYEDDLYGSDDDLDLENVPFSFDQEIDLLCRMNEQQMATIDELEKKLHSAEHDRDFLVDAVKALEKKVDVLQKELIGAVKGNTATVYVSCEHCRDEKDEAIATTLTTIAKIITPPTVEDEKEAAVCATASDSTQPTKPRGRFSRRQ